MFRLEKITVTLTFVMFRFHHLKDLISKVKNPLKKRIWQEMEMLSFVKTVLNARPHTVRQTQALLGEQFHWDIFEHSPYSSDLAPSNFLLFPKMKEHLTGKRFANDEDLKNAVGGHTV